MLCQDSVLRPVRGQVLKLRGEQLDHAWIDDTVAEPIYVLPRPDDMIVGGTAPRDDENLRVDVYGTCDRLVYERRNKCWGYFTESLTTNNVTLNTPCPFNVPAPEVGSGGEHLAMEDPVATRAAHAGSAVLPLDLNGDGVKDLLLGDISYNNLVAIYTGGNVDDALMVAKDSWFTVY